MKCRQTINRFGLPLEKKCWHLADDAEAFLHDRRTMDHICTQEPSLCMHHERAGDGSEEEES